MSSLIPPENRKRQLLGVADDDQAAGARVDDVVDALAQRRAGRDHLERLDEPGLLATLQIGRAHPRLRCAIRHDSTRAFAGFDGAVGVPLGRGLHAAALRRRAGAAPRAPSARTASPQRRRAVSGATTRRQAELRGLLERGGRGGRPSAARRSARSRRSRRAARASAPPAATPRAALATASATARSAPGSSTRTPPTTLTKTSAVPSADAGVAREHGEHEREAVAVDAADDAPRRHELASARRAPAPRRAAAASPPSRASTTLPGARVASRDEARATASSDLDEAAVAHLEDADLVRRAEAVLQRAQRAVGALALALELQHAVDEVLEHARAGERALLGHVADEQHGGAAALGDVA